MEIASVANSTAGEAAAKADVAKETAGNAENVAIGANDKADSAKYTADEAKAIAGQSLATAADALETAENAGKTASAADAKADNAVVAANAADAKADDAVTKVNAAAAAANAASATAGNALSTANAARALCVDMKGASATAAGAHGFAPAPAAGAANRFLRSDGTWSVPPDTDTTYAEATQTASGLMSPDDKKKLDGIAAGATATAAPPQAATAAPRAHGTAAVGTSAKYAREDHVHPSNNTDTHWTSHLYAGSGAAANAATTNGNTKLTICDNSTVRNTVAIKGAGAASVTSDAAGNITITGTNTTYAAATQTANGLMSAADKSKLDGFSHDNILHRWWTDTEWLDHDLNSNSDWNTPHSFVAGYFLAQTNNLNYAPAINLHNMIYTMAEAVAKKYYLFGNISLRTKDWTEIPAYIDLACDGNLDLNIATLCVRNRTNSSEIHALSIQHSQSNGAAAYGPEVTSATEWAANRIATTQYVRNKLAGTASVASLSADIEIPQEKEVLFALTDAEVADLTQGILPQCVAEQMRATTFSARASMPAYALRGRLGSSSSQTATQPAAKARAAMAADSQTEAAAPEEARQVVAFQLPLSPEDLLENLRAERNRRLLVVDAQIAILNRRLRRAGNLTDKNKINNQISAWDEYALALCDLPDQEGAPWDGGGRETPWPTPPVSPAS